MWGKSFFVVVVVVVVVYLVKAHMRANTQCIARGHETRRGRRGKDKTVGNRDSRRSVEGRGMGRGTRGIQDGHHRDFQDLTRQGLSGRKAGNLKEVGLGWMNGGTKDRGFGWG